MGFGKIEDQPGSLDGVSFSGRSYKITHYWGIKTIVAPLVLVGIMGFQFIRLLPNLERSSTFVILLIVNLLLLMLSVLQLVINIKRRLQKPSLLETKPGSIRVGNEILHPEMINCIMIDGYFNPVIGIRPIGKRVTPGMFVFRMIGSEEELALQELSKWAETHQVGIKNKNFLKWM